MKKRTYLLAGMVSLAVMVAIVVGLLIRQSYSTDPRQGEMTGARIDGIRLTERSGERFQFDTLDGQIWIGSVFFTACPQICRRQNMQVARLQREYGPRGVRFVSVTCNPEVDTPKVLSDYAEIFNADPQQWLFLTGNTTDVQQVGRHVLGVSVEKNTHSELLIVFDRTGKIRGRYAATNPAQIEMLQRLLDRLLALEPHPIVR